MTYRSLKKTFQNFKPIHIGAMLMMPTIVIPMLYFADTQKAPPSTASSSANKPTILKSKSSSPELDVSPSGVGIPGIPQKQNASPNQSAPTTLVYNIAQGPDLKGNQSLQRIVDEAVGTFQNKGLPTDKLSISLINVKNPKCQAYAQYKDRQPRFPASVSKLFWMVALYGKINSNTPLQKPIDRELVRKMIQKSDNEAASDVVDAITGTTSGDRLSPDQLSQWDNQRKSINTFFNVAGYQNIDISQKNFPIPKLEMMEPKGRDLQIRGDERSPIRNSLTTYDVSRLAYEIHSRKAVSVEKSEIMESLMVRDLHPEVWKQEQYNSIQGFLAEKLPLDTYVASKVGWTASSRQDVAIVQSRDGAAHYILTIFGDDKRYAEDWDIFPAVSRQIFEQMKLQDSSSCGNIS
jgi:hypothetical protein